MHDQKSQDKKNSASTHHDFSKDDFDYLLKDGFNYIKKIFQHLLGMDITKIKAAKNTATSYLLGLDFEKKKAISFTLIIMTLCFFLGFRNVPLLNFILSISSDYFEEFNEIFRFNYIANYMIFLIVWSPAIYLLKLYWNSKTTKFRLCLAYAAGLLIYRLTHGAWDLYDLNNFVACFGITAVFVSLAAALIHFVKEAK